MVKYIQNCRFCKNPNLTEVMDFGEHFSQGSFVYKDQPTPPNRTVPMRILRCDKTKFENACGLIQNSVTISPEILYSNYGYRSSITKTMRDNLQSIVEKIKSIRIGPIKEVLDCAANDLTLLSYYDRDVNKTAVDPSNITKNSVLENTRIINKCYPCDELKRERRNFDVITCIACLYDIEDLKDFLANVRFNLKPDGIFCFEVAYLPSVIANLAYGQFCHEHLSTFSFEVLQRILKECGLKIFRTELTDTNDGSILCFVCYDYVTIYDKPEYEQAMLTIKLLEFNLSLDTNKPYDYFKNRILQHKEVLVNLLAELKNRGKSIFLLGASTKINMLIQTCGIQRFFDYGVERDERKIGGQTMFGLPVISEEEARQMKPDVYFIGPTHFLEEIKIREQETMKNGTQLLVPIPKIKLISYDGENTIF